MNTKALLVAIISIITANGAEAGYAGYLNRGEYASGRAVREGFLCGGYISESDTARLKPAAQRDAASSCRSGRARRASGWDINCLNSNLVVYADFICQ